MLAFLLACSGPASLADRAAEDDSASAPIGDSTDDSGTAPPGPLGLPALSVRGVLVLHIDTLRADHLPAYGYARDTTPHLSARPWHVVHGERATTSWTMPSTASFLTSLEPEHHGLLWWSLNKPNAPLVATTWPERLAAAGWATGLFTGNPFASANSYLDRGFDVAELHPKESTGEANLEVLGTAFLAWLDALPAGQPFMAHLQPVDMHTPYSPGPENLAVFRTDPLPFDRDEARGYSTVGFGHAWDAAAGSDTDGVTPADIDQAAVDLYDADLLGLDASIDALLTALDERGLLADTLVVLTADHGESLDDAGNGAFGHQIAWREELVQLPLLFLHPDVAPGESTCIAENVDIWPTLAAALGVPPADPADALDGIDLAAGCRTGARGSLWTNTGVLDTLGASSTAAALQRDCSSGVTTGTAFETPDPTETTPVSDLPGGEALKGAIDAHAGEVAGSGGCEGG